MSGCEVRERLSRRSGTEVMSREAAGVGFACSAEARATDKVGQSRSAVAVAVAAAVSGGGTDDVKRQRQRQPFTPCSPYTCNSGSTNAYSYALHQLLDTAVYAVCCHSSRCGDTVLTTNDQKT